MAFHQERHVDHFPYVAAVAEDVRGHDRGLLARLGHDQLTAQYHARWLLHQHLRRAWDTARASGQDPARDPVLGSLAVLCDLTSDLLHNAGAVAASPVHPPSTPSVRPQVSERVRPSS